MVYPFTPPHAVISCNKTTHLKFEFLSALSFLCIRFRCIFPFLSQLKRWRAQNLNLSPFPHRMEDLSDWPTTDTLIDESTYPQSLTSTICHFKETLLSTLWVSLQKTKENHYYGLFFNPEWKRKGVGREGVLKINLTQLILNYIASQKEDVLPLWCTFEEKQTKAGKTYFNGKYGEVTEEQRMVIMDQMNPGQYQKLRSQDVPYDPEDKWEPIPNQKQSDWMPPPPQRKTKYSNSSSQKRQRDAEEEEEEEEERKKKKKKHHYQVKKTRKTKTQKYRSSSEQEETSEEEREKS